jgi:hypothetical protein
MKIIKVWFEDDHIYGETDDGRTLWQSLLWYPRLKNASEKEREGYTFGLDGVHWRNINDDVSFESFEYDNKEPKGLSRFFLSHREINASAVARRAGISPNLMAQYISGAKEPSKEREMHIMQTVIAMVNDVAMAATEVTKQI